MARWYPTDVAGDAFGPILEAPDKRQALDRATALHGLKVFGVVSVVEWEEIVAQRQAEARAKRGKQ
jgi:hypothetical protein